MNLKQRRTRWILGILAVVFITVGFLVFFYSFSERKHIQYVERIGGSVRRRPIIPFEVYNLLPQQFRRYIPEGSVMIVSISRDSVTDEEIEPISEYFPHLQCLDLSGTRITDEILKPISKYPRLEALFLGETQVTDEGIKFLSQSRSLTQVSLNSTKITDASIVYLSQMKQLHALSAEGTPLTDKSVEILCQMPNLEFLSVEETQISDDGLKRLKAKGLLD